MCLTRDELSALLAATKERKFKPGDTLFSKDGKFDGLFVVTRGIVEERVGGENMTILRGLGSIVSFANMVNPDSKKALFTAAARTDVTANCIPTQTLEPILRKNAKFREIVAKSSILVLAKLHPGTAKELATMEENSLNEFIATSEFKMPGPKDKLRFPNGGFCLLGSVRVIVAEGSESKEKYGENSYIPPSDKEFAAGKKDTVVLVFTKKMETFVKEHDVKHKKSHGKHKASISVAFEKEREVDIGLSLIHI
eukprot:TRINITY_DN890_c0_g1_i3.p1 TRINITY_DN890_c0_g1~~TRINITY_DN890_c0_g1_i3.p1  ORF type:complete len:253 (+),score=70.81 TRINITY_DN890_c0_g1_i3:189-947(+)